MVAACPYVGGPVARPRTRVPDVDESDLEERFGEYLSAFAALGRGESQPARVVAHYDVPLLVTTDDVVISLGTSDDVAAWLQGQAEAMAAAHYDHTETLASAVTVLNQRTAVHRAEFSRRRRDGAEINRLTVTYVITRASNGFRISALLVHSP